MSSVASRFESAGTYVGIERVDANTYWLVQDLGSGQELRWKLLNNGSAHCLNVMQVFEGNTLVEDLFSWGSVWEYAFDDPTYGWIGNGHGQDVQQSLSFQVDGSPVTLADGQRVTGVSVAVTRVSRFQQTGTELHLGDCTLVYSLDPAAGLSTEITIDWAIPPVTGFGGMLPLNNRFSRGVILDCPANWDLTTGEATETTPVTPTLSSPLALCFEYSGHWAAMLQTGDGRSRNTFIEDRSTEGNKIYASEAGEDLGGNVRRFTNNYRVKNLASPRACFLSP